MRAPSDSAMRPVWWPGVCVVAAIAVFFLWEEHRSDAFPRLRRGPTHEEV